MRPFLFTLPHTPTPPYVHVSLLNRIGAGLGIAETSVAGAISYARGTDGHKLDHFIAGAIVGGVAGLISLRKQPTKTYNGNFLDGYISF